MPVAYGDACPDCGAKLPQPGAECPSCAATVADEARPVPSEFTGPSRIATYRILRELGAGGMGTVYEAHDERMDRRVALKVLSRHRAPSEKSAKRFAQEAWIAGRLSHPHIVKVHDRGEWEELSYYAMELVGGGSLSDVIGNLRRSGRDDRLGLEHHSAAYVNWAIRTVIDAARGLDYAHREGVVHRDVKPMNLLLAAETGQVKIADFGLAIDQEVTRMTTAGTVLGTLAYMAPEQMLGKQQEIGPHTDVYALGVTLFELLTLALPFTGETQQLYMNAVLTAEARRPRKLNTRVGRDLEIVIKKTLEKDPRHRYASAAAFADDLENVAHFRPILAQPPGPVRRVARWVRRRPIHAALIAVVALGLPALVFLAERAVERRRLADAARIEELQQQVRWHWQRSAPREVIEPASAILRLDPDHPTALQTRAASYIALATEALDQEEAARLQAAALDDVSRLVAAHPGLAWPHRLRAHALRTFGRAAEAEQAEAEAARHGTREASYYDLYLDAGLAAQSGDDERAVQLLGDALVLRPQDIAALAARALALERLGRVPAAIQDYRVLLALWPEDHVTMYKLGQLLAETGSPDEGRKYVQRVLAGHPNNPLVYQDLADDALARGRADASRGDRESARALYEEAEAHARRSLDLDPDAAWSQLNLGASLMEQNRLRDAPDTALIEEAVAHYERAMELLRHTPGGQASPEYTAALVNTCDARIQAGDLDGALDTCTAVTVAAPAEAIGFYNLAGVHALAGRTDEALAALERDLALGDYDWRTLEGDVWFVSMREEPGFRELLEKMKRAEAAPTH